MEENDWFWAILIIAFLALIMAYGGYHPGDLPEDPRR
jgi:hypothetical protein